MKKTIGAMLRLLTRWSNTRVIRINQNKDRSRT